MSDLWSIRKIVDSQQLIHAILLDSEDNVLYYATGDSVWKQPFIKNAQRQQVIAGYFVQPSIKGIAKIDNKIYVTDMYKHQVRESTLGPRISESTLVGGEKGYNDGPFQHQSQSPHMVFPWGIVADKNGDLLITDDHRVRRLNMKIRALETIAGDSDWSFVDGGFKDGKERAARFRSPTGIAVDDEGTIYVCDCYNHCIRKIQNGFVSTIAGTPQRKGHKDGLLKESLFECPRGITLKLFLLDITLKLFLLAVTDDSGLRIIDLEHNSVTTKPGKFTCVTSDQYGNLYAGSQDGIFLVNRAWSQERLLWIGLMKEEVGSCHVAKLPKEIVKEIAQYVRTNTVRKIQTQDF